MEIIQSMITNNLSYQQNKKMKPLGIMLHSVGCSQSSAQVFVNTFNKSSAQVSVHAVVEHTGKVYQCMPWDTVSWHCGGAGNNYLISVEMTEPDYKTPDSKAQIKGTYQTAVELFAWLCKKYGLSTDSIIGHYEGYARGIATNHADPRLLWTQYGTEYTMDKFRADVKATMEGIADTSSAETKEEKTETTTDDTSVQTFKLKEGATYYDGRSMPSWLFGRDLYIREIKENRVVFSTLKEGFVTGAVHKNNIIINGCEVDTKTESTSQQTNEINVGDKFKLGAGATYYDGGSIPSWVFACNLYVREIRDNGAVVFSTLKIGPVTGVVDKKYVNIF